MTTNEPTKCPVCGCKGYRPIEATAIPDVDVICIKCGTPYQSAEVTPVGGIMSEPTTGEIIGQLNEIIYNVSAAYIMTEMPVRVASAVTPIVIARDRLESQEQSNERLTTALAEVTMKVGELTARAEQAERERDAAVEHVHDAIFGTNHSCFYCTMENCDGCTNRTVKEHFKYRGLLPRKYLVKNEGEAE